MRRTNAQELVTQQTRQAVEEARQRRLQGNPPSTVPRSTSRPSRPTSTRSNRVNELMRNPPRIDTVAMVRDQARNAYIENRANRLNNLANNLIINIRRQVIPSVQAVAQPTRPQTRSQTRIRPPTQAQQQYQQIRNNINLVEENIADIFNNNETLINLINSVSNIDMPTPYIIYNNIHDSMKNFLQDFINNHWSNVNYITPMSESQFMIIKRQMLLQYLSLIHI